MSAHAAIENCAFLTLRLSVGPWHEAAERHGIDLAETVCGMLTPATTQALPPSWQGVRTIEQAEQWIVDRDLESPTLLVADPAVGEPVALLVLYAESGERDGTIRIRIGYAVRESRWGEGVASELVRGLVDWALDQPAVEAIVAGVESDNPASIRVLTKNGFVRTDGDPTRAAETYVLDTT